MRTLSILAICCGLCLPLLGAEDITIQNANTDNPTLLYKHKPMLKTGPICERRVFMYAIGGHKNIMIDLMNEGAIIEGMTKEWINHTLKIIEGWEAKNDRDILVGMDIDHFLMKKDTDSLHWLLSHPGIEIIVGEDKWIYFSPEEMISMRAKYKKPMIWVNEKAVGYMDTFSLCDYPNRRLHYLWMGMMTKMQGLGLYEKENHTQTGLLAKPQAQELGKYNLILMRFFENHIKDYALLRNKNDIIKNTPPVTRKVALSSAVETIVYLHKGFEQRQEAGAKLELANLSVPDGSVSVRFVHPNTGESSTQRANVKNASLTLTLPEFYENLAIAIAGK